MTAEGAGAFCTTFVIDFAAGTCNRKVANAVAKKITNIKASAATKGPGKYSTKDSKHHEQTLPQVKNYRTSTNPHGIYEPAPYHGKQNNPRTGKSKAPAKGSYTYYFFYQALRTNAFSPCASLSFQQAAW